MTVKLTIVLAALVAVAFISVQQNAVTALKDGKFVYNQRNHLSCEDVDNPDIDCKGTSGYVANGVTPDTHENENNNDNRKDTCKENSHSVPNKGSSNNNDEDDAGESVCDP